MSSAIMITALINPWILVIAASALLSAQTPTFRASTRLIQVSVIVTDHRGEPVRGLQKSSFTIFDQGHPQKIVFFSQQSGKSQTPAAAAKQNFFSNQPDEKTERYRSATVVLFDRLNTDFQESGFARERLAQFLSGVRPDDRIALYGLASNLVVLHDFTEDASALLRALNEYKPGETNETRATTVQQSTAPLLFAGMENRVNQKESDTLMGGRVKETAAALEAIANHLAGLPGRKNLVWISAAFPITIGYFQKRMIGARPERDNFDADVEAASRALSNANVAIYPVDAHVLAALGGVYDSAKAPKVGALTLQTTVPLPELTPTEALATMTHLAEQTGGRVFSNTNDIAGAVRRAIDDSEFSYTLAYYPDHDHWDGKFREIKVKVAGAGLQTRYRSGYLAVGESAPAPAAVNIADVIRRPIESSEMGLSIEAERIAERQFKLHIRVDPAAMHFEQKDGRWLADLEVLWVQVGADGHEVSGHGQTLHFRLSSETYGALPREGFADFIGGVDRPEKHAVPHRGP